MWTTYSGHLYMAEKQLEEDIKWWMEENPPETEERKQVVDRRWEDESEDVKRQFERDGYYTVPLGDELGKLIREVYKEEK